MAVTIDMLSGGGTGITLARLTKPELAADETFELDLLEASSLDAALRKLKSEGGDKIVLDMQQVAYMDSKSFWAVVKTARAISEGGGCLVVSNLHSSIARLLALTGADEFLLSYGTVEEATSALRDG